MIQEDEERAEFVSKARETYSVEDLMRGAVRTLDEKKATDPAILYIEPFSTLADYIIVVTASSSRHLNVMADALRDLSRNEKFDLLNREATEDENWIVMDFGTVLVHLFTSEYRSRYQIEDLYKQGERREFSSFLPAEPQT